MYNKSPKYTKLTKNLMTEKCLYQMLQGLPKYTKIWGFGMKIYHLATLERHTTSLPNTNETQLCIFTANKTDIINPFFNDTFIIQLLL
jgi:hypothetical protein